MDADENGKFRVFDGEARVTGGNQTLSAKKGRQVLLGAVLDMSAFDVKETDALMRWAARRSENLATANVSSAKSASNLGYLGGYGGYGSGLATGGSWAYNPWYGMFTFMPFGNSMYYSPYFGFPYYSPYNVGYAMPSGTGFTSAFPISTTSPHFSGGGTGGFSPRPSVPLGGGGSSSGATSTASRATNSGLLTGGSGNGSSGSTGFGGGGLSSGGSGSRGSAGGSPTGGRAR